MNFKKLAVVVATLTVSVSSFALDFDLAKVETGTATRESAAAELAESTLVTGDAQVGLINQESSNNIAVIDQTGTGNFAAITQATNEANIATIYQIGDLNKAVIFQR